MKAVILAGGFGTRLSEETDRIPKPMVQIGDRPILWHIMKLYSHYGINDFIICLGYKGYIIKEYFHNYFIHMSDITLDMKNKEMEVHANMAEPWRVTLIDTGQNTMTGGRLKRIRKHLDDSPFCMTYGDGLSDVDIGKLIAQHKDSGKLATLTAVNPPGRFGVLEVVGNTVTGFKEKVANPDSMINGGFFVLEPQALDTITDDGTYWEREPMEQLAQQGQLMAYQHSGFWQPMDTLREKKYLEKLWLSDQAPWRVWDDPSH
jgi:glucose-1-phosphate cytidylyltransferase